MKKLYFAPILSVVAVLFSGLSVKAQTWNVDGNGTWGNSTLWTPATVPDAQDAAVVFGNIITAGRTITLNQNATVGSIVFNEDTVGANAYTLNFNANQTLTFDVTAGNAVLNARGSGGYAVGTQGSGTIQLNDSLAISAGSAQAATSDGATIALNSRITGTGGLILSSLNSNDGTGTDVNGARGTYLRSTTANDFSGGVTVNSGYVGIAGNIGNLGSGTLTLNASNPAFGGQGTNLVLKTGGGTLTNNIVFGNSAYSGGSNGLQLNLGDTGNYTLSGNLSGTIAGNSLRIQAGTGSLTFSGNGSGLTTGTGVIHVRTGTVTLNNANAIGTGNVAGNGATGGWQLGNFSNGSTGTQALLTNGFDVGGRVTTSQTGTAGQTSNDNLLIGGVHTSGTATFSGNVTVGRIVSGTRQFQVTSATGGTTVFSGIISESGSAPNVTSVPVVKVGNGTVTFTANNTYAGGTTVSAGTLLINGQSGSNSGTGTGNVSVSTGAILGGTGQVRPGTGNSISVSGIIAPGDGGINTLTFNGGGTAAALATFNSGATFAFDINGTLNTSDRLALVSGAAGDFVFNNNVINFTLAGALSNGQTYTLFSSDVAGAYSGLTIDGSNIVTAGLSFTGLGGDFQTNSYISLSGNNLVLNAIPEPSTYVLLGLGLAGLCALRRRQHQS